MTIPFIFNEGESDPRLQWEDLREGAFSALLEGGYELGVSAVQSEGLAVVSVRDESGSYVVRNVTLIPSCPCDLMSGKTAYKLTYNGETSLFSWEER